MYLFYNDDMCNHFEVVGGICNQDKYRDTIDNSKFNYDRVILIKFSEKINCFKLENCKDFVGLLKNDIISCVIGGRFFKKTIKNNEDIKYNLLLESVDNIASKLKDVKIEVKDDYCIAKSNSRKVVLFNQYPVRYELLNNNFNLKRFAIYKENLHICNYCNNMEGKGYFTINGSLCDKCFYKINKVCAKIGGNEKLAQEITIKNI